MGRKTIAALALAATVAAGLTLSCSDGVVEPGEVFQMTGTVRYYTFEGGFWAIRGDDDITYDLCNGLPEAFREEGLRVKFIAEMTNLIGFRVGTVVRLLMIQRLGPPFP